MKKLLFSLALTLLLTACGTTPTPVPTPTHDMGVSDAVIRLVEQGAIQQVTQQAIENERREAQAAQTATQAIVGGTATVKADSENRQATAAVAKETQRVFNITLEAAKLHDAQTAQAADARSTRPA